MESSRILIQNPSRFWRFTSFSSTVGKNWYLNHNLDKIAVILVVDLVLYVQY